MLLHEHLCSTQVGMELLDGNRQGTCATLAYQSHGVEVFPLCIYTFGVDRNNSRMLQPRSQLRFGMKTTNRTRVVPKFRTNFLYCNLAIAVVIVRQVNNAHSAGP